MLLVDGMGVVTDDGSMRQKPNTKTHVSCLEVWMFF